jgi:predicted transcriptional regulator of viral defense system
LGLLRRVAGRQDGVVTREQALVTGWATHEIDTLCRTGRWRRLAHGAYLIDPAAAPASRRARVRAAVLSLGPGAVAVLGTAAELHGIAGLPRSDEIHVAVPSRAAKRRVDSAVHVHQRDLVRRDVHTVTGIAVTRPVRTIADLLLRTHRYAAVALVDSALHRGLLTADGLAEIPELVRRRRGAVAARRHLGEADGRAQSPLETRVRLRCVDGRVRPVDLQHVIRDDDGHVLGVADLAWPGARLAVEADGVEPHGTPEAVYADRRRQNRLADAGWRVLRFTWQDALRRDYIPYTVSSALRGC